MIIEKDSSRRSQVSEIRLKKNSSSSLIDREVFHVDDYSDLEEKKLLALVEEIEESDLLKKSNMTISTYVQNQIIQDRPTLFKYLNMFDFDPHVTAKHLKNLVSLMRKYEIYNLKVESSDETIESALNTGFLYHCGNDIESRPIVGIDITKYNSFVSKISTKKEFINATLTFINRLIKHELIPGAIEQIIIFIDLQKFCHTGLIHGYDDVLKVLQYAFPSLVYKIYISSLSANAVTTGLLLTQNFLKYNTSRIVKFDIERIEEYSTHIPIDILLNYFGRTSNIEKNSHFNLSNADWQSANNNLGSVNIESSRNLEPILYETNKNQSHELIHHKDHLETTMSKTNFLHSLSIERIGSFDIPKASSNDFKFSKTSFALTSKKLRISKVDKKKEVDYLVFERANNNAPCCNFDTCIIN